MQSLPPAFDKVCTKCLLTKSADCFAKNQARCRQCKAEYYQDNRAHVLNKNKEWALKNPEKTKAIKRKNYEGKKAQYLLDAKERYLKNSEVIKARTRKRYKEKTQAVLDQAREYYAGLSEERKKIIYARSNEGAKKFPHLSRARCMQRRARLLRATPPWLTAEHKKQIQDIYYCAVLLQSETRVKHHVDHIVPLRGRTVCGLHVPWNLRPIPAKENVRKSNRLEDFICN